MGERQRSGEIVVFIIKILKDGGCGMGLMWYSPAYSLMLQGDVKSFDG